ncbi:hypothetical protein PENSPDRAFT_118513 [Peniophora sp. CONT]|nr:hypothetical protein PENSPDRAFT_118513 [Peniophora sp. CONT]
MDVIARIAIEGAKTSIGEDILQRVCRDLQKLTSIVRGARQESSPRGLRFARFIAECKAHAPSEWQPSLSLFDTAIQRGVLNKSIHHYLRQLWVDFGAALGLKEDEERARLAHQMRVHCAWPTCVYHTSEPGRALASCKGCGQVRYCGKVCQTDHWKAGHKQECGNRLKD